MQVPAPKHDSKLVSSNLMKWTAKYFISFVKILSQVLPRFELLFTLYSRKHECENVT